MIKVGNYITPITEEQYKESIDKKIDFLLKVSQVLSDQLRNKEPWDLRDFRIAQWMIFLERDYRLEYGGNKVFVKALDRVLKFTESQIFKNKMETYFEYRRTSYILKNKEDSMETIFSKKLRDDEIFFKLIEWEKAFLFVYKERILKAQAFEDNRFFKRLANVLKKGTQSNIKKIKKSALQLRNNIVEMLLNKDIHGIDLKKPKHSKLLYKALLISYRNLRIEAEKQDNLKKIKECDEVLNMLNDENYFIYKWLPRHVLGGDRK